MNENDRLSAIEDIRQAKARYVRGADTGNAELIRGMLADDCVQDFRKCWTDPTTGEDLLPEINVVMRGVASWSPEGFASLGVVSEHTSVHHVYTARSPSAATRPQMWSGPWPTGCSCRPAGATRD